MGIAVSLVTFFAAAKKVTAAPHRGNANRPTRKQEVHRSPTQSEEQQRKRLPPRTGAGTNRPTRNQDFTKAQAHRPQQQNPQRLTILAGTLNASKAPSTRNPVSIYMPLALDPV